MGRELLHELLEGLDAGQREAVTSTAAPLCILAGAGSGKTRVLTRRIAWRVARATADPRHVLALTFTRKAAGELVARLTALGIRDRVAAGTFHAVAYAQLRRHWADRGQHAPALLDRKVRLLAPLLGRRRDGVQPVDVAAEIEWAKARLVPPDRYEAEAARAGRRPPLPASAVATLFHRYEHEKRRRGLVDFDDLLLLCADALETDREFAAGQRWRFRHLFVDEFQDVNPAQFRLLDGWRGHGSDLCVVGDPNQAIYAWNGADASYLTAFRGRFPDAGIVRLDDNYRSTPQVLAVANAVLGRGPRGTRPLRSNRADGPIPAVRSFPTDRDETTAIARALRDQRGPDRPWSHFAVLTRTNAQLVLFEEALRAAAIPYRVRGAGAFLQQPEVVDALHELRARASAPLSAAIVDLDERAASVAPDERRRELEELVRLAREHADVDPAATVDGFLAWLRATVGPDDAPSASDAVELATFHAAKGLEWPVVFLAGLERGLVPIGHADTPDARAEERRLLYVAVTRAQDRLWCTWAERRTFGTRTLTRSPSPYLETIEAVVAALEQGGTVDWSQLVGQARARLEQVKPPRKVRPEVGQHADPRVLEALKLWRSTTARASGVPAYVIFHDTTLAAVAEARPRDRQSLLALPGLGPVKADRYGDALLAVLAACGDAG